MSSIKILRTAIQLAVEGELLADVVERPRPCVMREERIAVTETLRQFRLQRIVTVVRAVAEVVNVLCPAEAIEEWPAIVPRHPCGEAFQCCLVDVECGAIKEDVRTFVTDVTHFNRNVVRQFVLQSYVVGINRGQPLLEIQRPREDTVRKKDATVGWDRRIWNTALIGRRVQAEEVGKGRRTLSEGKNACEVRWGVKVLHPKNRQVLRHRVAEQRTENADVIAATVAHTKDCLIVELIGRSQPRSKVVAVLDAAVERNVAHAGDENFTCVQVEETAVAGLVDGLRVDHVHPQSVVDRQLRGDAPCVLAVVEVTPLPLCGIYFRADVAAELGHVAEQESSHAEPSTAANFYTVCVKYDLPRTVLAERKLAGAMSIARHSQIVARDARRCRT